MDRGPATPVELEQPSGLAVDAAGDLFIADSSNNVVREVAAGTRIVTTVAGNGMAGHTGDSGPATSAELSGPSGVAADAAGDLFIADTNNNVVREVPAGTGIITIVAGDGTYGFSGDGGLATAAELASPSEIAVDVVGDLFIADSFDNEVREVAARTRIITTVAGNGKPAYSGDGGPAAVAAVSDPSGVAVDATGNLFIADRDNNVIRKVAVSQTAVSSQAQPVGLAAGNFTGNGTSILTVDREPHAIIVLPNDGPGGFGDQSAALMTSTTGGLAVNADPGPAVAGDFHATDGLDGSRTGKEDIAVLREDTSEVWVFTNNGDGTFQHTFSIKVGSSATGLSLASGPTPGLFDLLVGDRSGDILTLVGNGSGGFQALSLTGDRAPIAVQTVNGTGTPVALVGNQIANQVTVQSPQKGDAQFAPVKTLAPTDPSTQLAPGAVLWSPLDKGSSLSDAIVIASGSNSVLVYRALSLNAAGEPTFAPPVTYPVGTDPVSATVADINGDGIPDLLVANTGSNDVSVLFGGYNSSGDWVGSPGPRLMSAGAGPMSVNLVPDLASSGGHDLAITNQDGTLDVLPGRGQGFFDDRSPLAQKLGLPISQPPTFVPGSETGYVVTSGGALLQFNLANPTVAPIEIASSGVMAVATLPDGELVEALASGDVELIRPGASEESLFPLNGSPSAPSDIVVLNTSSGIEALVTSEGSDAIFPFTLLPGSDTIFLSAPPGTTETSPAVLVTSLLTVYGPVNGTTGVVTPVFNPLLDRAATSLDAAALVESARLADTDLLSGVGEVFFASLRLDEIADTTGPATPDALTELQGLVTGVAEGLQRLIEAAREGNLGAEGLPMVAPPGGAPKVTNRREKLLESLPELPRENPQRPPVPGETPEEGTQNHGVPDSVDGPRDRAIEDQEPEATRAAGRTAGIPLPNGTEEERLEFGRVENWFESVAEGIPVEVASGLHQQAAAGVLGVSGPDGLSTCPEDASPLWLLVALLAITPTAWSAGYSGPRLCSRGWDPEEAPGRSQ